MINKNVKSMYLSSVKKALKYVNKDSKKLINSLKVEVDIFISEHSDVTLNDLISKFGSPSDIAESFYANLDISELKKQKRIKGYIITAILVVVLTFIVCTINYYTNLHKDLPVYTIDTITEE